MNALQFSYSATDRSYIRVISMKSKVLVQKREKKERCSLLNSALDLIVFRYYSNTFSPTAGYRRLRT